MIAGEILKGIQSKAAESDIELDIGQLPDIEATDSEGNDDPERLARLVARVVARAGDRIGVFRKLSRHLEGQERRAGILSDAAAAVTELYRRNPDTFRNLGKQARSDFNARRMQRAAEKETPNNGGTVNASR